MVCKHLTDIEQALLDAGIKETFRGTPWSQNCREWVYFDVVLDVSALKLHFDIPDCVEIHENTDQRSGIERGMVCTECQDAIMGNIKGNNIFPG